MFRQKSPGNIITLFFFGLLLKLPLFLFPRTITASQNDEDFYRWLLGAINSIGSGSGVVCSLLAFVLLYLQALLLNYLVAEYRMMPRPNYLPGMAFLLLTSLVPEWSYLSSPLVSLTFIIVILLLIFSLYNTAVARARIFNIGLLLGISSYFYFPSAAFLLCILLGLVILKPFRLNEMVLLLMGCLTPYYFIAAYLFLRGQLSFASFFPHLSFQTPQITNNIWLAVTILLVAIPFLAGGYFVQANLHKMLIQVRKGWSVMLLYVVLAFFIPFVNSNSSFSNWILLVAPFACFHAATYYYPARRWVPNVLLLLTAGYVLYQQYGTTVWR